MDYNLLFKEFDIIDPDLQKSLVSFVEDKDKGELDPSFYIALDQNEKMQGFIEKAFDQQFAPLQKLVKKFS